MPFEISLISVKVSVVKYYEQIVSKVEDSPIVSSLEFLFKMYVMTLYESESAVLNSKLNIRSLQMRPI